MIRPGTKHTFKFGIVVYVVSIFQCGGVHVLSSPLKQDRAPLANQGYQWTQADQLCQLMQVEATNKLKHWCKRHLSAWWFPPTSNAVGSGRSHRHCHCPGASKAVDHDQGGPLVALSQLEDSLSRVILNQPRAICLIEQLWARPLMLMSFEVGQTEDRESSHN